MEIKELDKKQFILLILLITFVVSIATGIVTVSLMNQMPKSVPQTINNVIQRTIEKVTTVQVPAPVTEDSKEAESNKEDGSSLLLNNGDALVSIYLKDNLSSVNPTAVSGQDNNVKENNDTTNTNTENTEHTAIGQGVIISDIGLILVDSSILGESESYKVVLDKIDFDATVLKKFNNGFAILKISTITDKENTDIPTATETENSTQ